MRTFQRARTEEQRELRRRAILDAAQLALFEVPGERLILVPRDTAGTADGAAKAARAVIDDGSANVRFTRS